jgi:hypothetical protein
LFAEVNRTEFVQHLFPTPSTKGIYRKITSTLLSAILTYYLKSKKSAKEPIPDGIIPEDLEAKESLPYWTKIPHTVWNIVFPGISSFVDGRALHGQKLQFVHFAVIDSYTIKPLFAKLNSATANYNGGFNSRSWHSMRNQESNV